MSLIAMGWASWQEMETASLQITLLYIAERLDDESGVAWPSVAWLSKRTRLDERSVRKSLKALADLGEIADTGRRAGQQKNVVVWRMPKFEAYDLARKSGNPNKNVGVGISGTAAGTQPAEVVRENGSQTGPNGQPLQNCQGSASGANSTPTNLHPNPDKNVPPTPTNLSGDSSLDSLKDSKSAGGSADPAGQPPSRENGSGFDARGSRLHWRTIAVNFALGAGGVLGVWSYGLLPRVLKDLPEFDRDRKIEIRGPIERVCNEIVDWAVEQHRQTAHKGRAAYAPIEAEITSRLNRELKSLAPAPACAQAAANAEAA